jgi:hypothetical protein
MILEEKQSWATSSHLGQLPFKPPSGLQLQRNSKVE